MMPTMPPRGRSNEKPSMSTLSPNALRTSLAVTTVVAESRRRRNHDLVLQDLVGRLLLDHFLILLHARLVLRLSRARRHAHPLELSLQRALSCRFGFLLDRQARALLLEPRRVVALVRNAVAAVELENPAGDVVEEVAIVRDGDDGARESRADIARATRRSRRRGGSSARRAAGCPALPTARDTVRRGVAHRLRVCSRRHPAAAAAARPSRSRSCCRDSRDRARRSAPARVACLASSLSIALSPIGSANAIEMSWNSWSSARCAFTASSTLPFTSSVGSSCGSCGKKPNPRALGRPRFALIVLVDAGHDAQQRGFSRAVRAEDADLRAVVERQPDAAQGFPATAGQPCADPS